MSRCARLLRSAGLAAALLTAARLAAAEPAEPVALTGPVAAVAGSLAPLDVDTYTISANAGDRIFVALFDERDGAFLDTRLAVRQGGTVLASDDDGGDGFLSRLALVAPVAGSYEIVVTGFRDAGLVGAHAEGAPTEAPYRLVVAVTAGPGSESEPNDAAGQENALPAGGGIVRGTLGVLDVDRYSLPVSGGQTVAVSLFLVDATGAPLPTGGELADTRLGLFAGGTAPFAENDDGGPGFLSNLARSAPSAASSIQIGVTGFRDAGYGGAHPEGPFDYVLVAAAFPSAVERCDVVAPFGQIDVDDINAIFAARGQAASGPDDPRDADGDGTITTLDASQCRLECTYPRCARTAPACGLLGIEPLGALVLVEAARRRRRARARAEV